MKTTLTSLILFTIVSTIAPPPRSTQWGLPEGATRQGNNL